MHFDYHLGMILRLFLLAFASFFLASQEVDLTDIDPELLKNLTPEQIIYMQQMQGEGDVIETGDDLTKE